MAKTSKASEFYSLTPGENLSEGFGKHGEKYFGLFPGKRAVFSNFFSPKDLFRTYLQKAHPVTFRTVCVGKLKATDSAKPCHLSGSVTAGAGRTQGVFHGDEGRLYGVLLPWK